MPDSDLEKLCAARARIAGARGLLVRPRACGLDECVTLLREAEGYLEWLRDSLPHGRGLDPELRAQAAALHTEIRQTGVLLAEAVRRGRRWLARLQAAAGYDSCGALLPLAPRGRIAVLG
ncbi:MAG TPA: hypothetical protein VMU80_16405 [Bryobacteraceae bacterium]|nr:hypothetical protein [Bryobacteraceae bacterium]